MNPYIRELSKGATAVVQMANFTNPSSGEKYKCAIKRIYCERIKNNLDMARVSSNFIFFLRKDAGSKTNKSFFFFPFVWLKEVYFFHQDKERRRRELVFEKSSGSDFGRLWLPRPIILFQRFVLWIRNFNIWKHLRLSDINNWFLNRFIWNNILLPS